MNLIATVLGDSAIFTAGGAFAFAAVGDLRQYRIPNRLPLIVAVAFLVMSAVSPPSFVLGGLAIGAPVLIAGMILFSMGLVGGGDVKLLAAATLWCGPALLAPFAMVASVVGIVLALVMLSPYRVFLPPTPARLAAQGALRQPMPMGVAISAGGLAVLFEIATKTLI
jgi:prepilin peptidase CpaA